MAFQHHFISAEEASMVRSQFGTPCYVVNMDCIRQQAKLLLDLPSAFGHTVRYAMKANSNIAVVKLVTSLGVHIDASSEWEVRRAVKVYGIAPDRVQLTSQYPVSDAFLEEFVFQGKVLYNACSLLQLENFCRVAQSIKKRQAASTSSSSAAEPYHVTIRVNPGIGSGWTARSNVGGPGSSFGIWATEANLQRVSDVLHQTGGAVVLSGIHSHIGSGTDAAVWQKAATMMMDIVARYPEVHTLSLGGGFKIDRIAVATTGLTWASAESTAMDMAAVGRHVKEIFEGFHTKTGRKLHLEIEPGTFFVAMAGNVVGTVLDVVDTFGNVVGGADAIKSNHTEEPVTEKPHGFVFAKLDAGMTEVLRPALYGAQHPIVLYPTHASAAAGGAPCEALVVGPCCESGDILTPAPSDPDGLCPRLFPQRPQPGDLMVIGGTGAYCSGMAATNYNSYPTAAEVAYYPAAAGAGEFKLIRARQSLEQLLENEAKSGF